MHIYIHTLTGAVPPSQSQPLLPHPPAPSSVPPPSQTQQFPFFTPPPPQIITPPKAVVIPVAPATISATPSAVAPASSEAKPQASSTPLVIGPPQNLAAGVYNYSLVHIMLRLLTMHLP